MRMVEIWEKRMREAGHEFAMVKTKNAIFDIAAIIADLPSILTIQFPARNPRSKKSASGDVDFTIKQENIAKRDIVEIRYFQD